jgi:hypothetical protein
MLMYMAVAFTPHDRPPRIMRFVQTPLPGENTICVLDHDQNILVINQPLFDALTPDMQRGVLRTHEPALQLIIDTKLIA